MRAATDEWPIVRLDRKVLEAGFVWQLAQISGTIQAHWAVVVHLKSGLLPHCGTLNLPLPSVRMVSFSGGDTSSGGSYSALSFSWSSRRASETVPPFC